MTKLIFIHCHLLALFFVNNTYGQTSSNTSGGNGTGTGGSLSYTIGQVNYIASEINGTSISPGVQQAYDISIVTGSNSSSTDLSITAFPNPTSDLLQLQVKNPKGISYQLSNNVGEILTREKITSYNSEIDLSNLSSGVYTLTILSETTSLKTFKIVKH